MDSGFFATRYRKTGAVKSWLATAGALCCALSFGCSESPAEWSPVDPGRGEKLPVLDEVMDFEFTDQGGQLFTRADLEGKIWVADLIFTNCPSICRDMTASMRDLAYRYRDEEEVGFLSFSVDPERDTPEVLARYAEGYRADSERWRFLTGDKERIYELAEKSLLVHVGEMQADGDIVHSDRFLVLDQKGRLRAFLSKSAIERDGGKVLDEVQHAVDLLLEGDAE